MRIYIVACIAASVICQGLAFLESLWGASQTWNGLKAGFGFSPFSTYTFASLPRTEKEAREQGWVADVSISCSNARMYKGNRYIKDNDRAVMILFDKNGYVAGLQAGIPKSSNKAGYPAPNYYKAFNEESDMWVVTAYFTEPADICSKGRSKAVWDRDGTGEMLAFQVGTTPDKLMRIPLDQNEVLTKTNFKEGKCFYTMGMHYWYNVSAELPCDQLFPAFIMYNRGKLNSFGWAFLPDYKSSPRWEHPTGSILTTFAKEPPACMTNQDHAFTTLHIYMTNSPRTNLC